MMMNDDHRTTVSNNPALDRPIKATADDAILAKLATVQAGYYSDPFLDALSQGSVGIAAGGTGGGRGNTSSSSSGGFGNAVGGGQHQRRRIIQPIIKRGTHARVCVMDRALSAFLRQTAASKDTSPTSSSPSPLSCQIVVLGAGKDTTYFRYLNRNIMGMEDDATKTAISNQDQQTSSQTPLQVHWYDVDHVSVIHEKASLIRRSNLLSNFCPDLVETSYGYHGQYHGTNNGGGGGDGTKSSSCHLVGHDLRDSPATLLEKLNLNVQLPTLFLMECVSMYVPIDASRNLLQAVATSADKVWIVCYEPILGDPSKDPFGRVMEQNLIRAGVAWPESCLLQTRTLQQQLEKLVQYGGFYRAVGCDMWSAYETVVSDEQRKRANQSEFLDEFEEWVLIMRHYCFVAACGGRRRFSNVVVAEHGVVAGFDDLTMVGRERNSTPLGFTIGKCIELEQER